ncbi:peptidoglycan DD-metalloendopeptidase family protein [Altererythrobacter endophyticus]|uniref:Peptidoglycan DD-metalloendopeptidase family protein n=2 Tax=Altericroceibacterium endophyticum TaxID=1808508 RepID=A0A6I4T459_9SPHN|nr:M23 family metallopeptidase [Altericroceibacterium endophyticum]MXO65687.1 peptidoglycan DD-metalloendopeptidase family protein [Altericroceibacterium endophyticum]
MRSQGQVRFVKLSSKLQMSLAGGAAAALLLWGGSMGVMAALQYQASSELESLDQRAVQVANAEDRVRAYRDDIGKVASDLEERQDFIEKIVDMLPPDMVEDAATETSEDEEAAETVAKVSAILPEAAGLARIEAKQLAFVDRLTHYAERRANRAEEGMRRLGLDPRRMLAAAQTAQGGPLEQLSTSRDGTVDPRFEKLGLTLSRMDALERGLQSVPQFMPADVSHISSGFGYRRDPFTGGGAMHKGLDFRGKTGTPIHAAAEGKVSFAGRRSGYGRVIEITHGNGLMTRYAHMSAFKAKRGQMVKAGDIIGAIGSSGRSTGPHLHFEVRINNRAVNPRPFLENAPHVLEDVREDQPVRIRERDD